MNDKELLELAAKAAEYVLIHEDEKYYWPTAKGNRTPKTWNPLTDDGDDALRLAVKLGLSLFLPDKFDPTVVAQWYDVDDDADNSRVVHVTEYLNEHNNDPYAATRRAIVRAAAEIGKAMK